MKIFPLISICALLSLVSVSEAQILRLEKRLNVSHQSKPSQKASTSKKSRSQQSQPKKSEPACETLSGLYNEESITLPKWLLKEVGDLNAQLKERLSASDYLEILKGEKFLLCKYESQDKDWKIEKVRDELSRIIEDPDNYDRFFRPRFVENRKKGTMVRLNLRYRNGDFRFFDESYAIERHPGLDSESSLCSFWEMRTGLFKTQFACQYVSGEILGKKTKNNVYYMPGFDIGPDMYEYSDWSGRHPEFYLVDPSNEIFQSYGDSLFESYAGEESGFLFNISKPIPKISKTNCPQWYSSKKEAMETLHMPCAPETMGVTWLEDKEKNGYQLSLTSLSLSYRGERQNDKKKRERKIKDAILKSMSPAPITKCVESSICSIPYRMDKFNIGEMEDGFAPFLRFSGYCDELYGSGYNFQLPYMFGVLTPNGETYFFDLRAHHAQGKLKRYNECLTTLNILDSAEDAFKRRYPGIPYQIAMSESDGNIEELYLGDGAPYVRLLDINVADDRRSAEVIAAFMGSDFGEMAVIRLNLNDYTYNVENHWDYRVLALPPVWISEKKLFLKPESDYQYSIIRAESGREERKIADLFIESPQRYALVLPDGRYAGSRGCESILEFGDGKHVIGMKALAPWRNRPAEVLEAIGGNADDIAALRETTKRWLGKLGYDPENMPAEPSLEDFPVAEVELPELFSQESVARFRVKVEATACDIAKLEIRADGVLLPQSWGENLLVEAGQEKEVIVEAPLANGQNWIEVKAIDNRGISGDTTRFRTIYKGENPSDLYIVALGVSDYDDPGMKLQYAAKDARDIAQAFEKYGTGRKHTLVLTDKEVKDKNSLQQVRDFLSATTIDDRVVFYVAGHGVLDERLNYYYAPAGFDGEHLAETGIPMDDLIGCLRGINARHRLLLLDTCHSGELGEEGEEKLALAGISLPQGVRAIQGRGMKSRKTAGGLNAAQKKRYIEEMFSYGDTERGINIIAGSAGAEFAWESDSWNNGVFTASVIKALRGEGSARNLDGDGFFSVEELQQKVVKEVQQLTAGQQKPSVVSEESAENIALTECTNYDTLKTLVEQNRWEQVEDYLKREPVLYIPEQRYLLNVMADHNRRLGQSEEIVEEAVKRHAPVKVVKMLLEHGAAPERNYRDAFQEFLRSDNAEYIKHRTEIGRVFIQSGIKEREIYYSPRDTGDEDFVAMLFDEGFSSFVDEPFKPERPISLFRVFLEHGVDPSEEAVLHDLVSHYCQIPAHDQQTREDILQKIKLVLEYGSEPNGQYGRNVFLYTNPDTTPLHQLCRSLSFNDALPAIKLLIEHGADIHRKDSKGKEPLDTWDPNYKTLVQLAESAKAGKSLDSVTVTRNSNAGASGQDRADLDPMIARMAALRCKHASSALYQKRLLTLLPLIRNGADVDITLPETKGNTALHYACGIGSWSITQWLVRHGANVNARTDRGKTPLDCVGDDNAKRIRELLISHGAKKSSELSSEGNSTSRANVSGLDADELNSLGLDYQYGKNGKSKNYNEAARCYRLAAEQGHARAQNNLGFCYHNGWGVPKDMSQAAMWYKRSADQGNAWGQSNYGTCLEFGWGVSKNIPSAIEMYRKAAAQGHASAKKHLKRHGITM